MSDQRITMTGGEVGVRTGAFLKYDV